MKCFTLAALCILNGDARLRILSTDASGCFIIEMVAVTIICLVRYDHYLVSFDDTFLVYAV